MMRADCSIHGGAAGDGGADAPARAAFVHPLLGDWQHGVPPFAAADAYTVDVLERMRHTAVERDGCDRPVFVPQDAALLADGLHYEQRIAERGVLATRERNAHDFFNALVWLRHPQLKHALNTRQVADLRVAGPKLRTRGQCALTHFDEAGAIVWLADRTLLAHWDAHDWERLFRENRSAWGERIAVSVFGHALVEHVWSGHDLPVAKALVVEVSDPAWIAARAGEGALIAAAPLAEPALAEAIAGGCLLADPQELRPLPFAGIPGWHVHGAAPDFLRTAACFRPLRPGRRYPPPWGPVAVV